MKCSICGTDNDDGAGFCRHCGVSIAQAAPAAAALAAATAICPTCQCSHAMPARFCDHCGTKLPSHPLAARGDGIAQTAPSSRTSVQPAASGNRPAARGASFAGAPLQAGGSAMMARTTSPSFLLSRALALIGANVSKATAGWLPALRERFRGLSDSGRENGRKRRFWPLVIGAVLSIALMIISGFWLARTLMVGEPPWKTEQTRKLPDAALLAAAARRMEPQSDANPQSPALSPSMQTEQGNALPGTSATESVENVPVPDSSANPPAEAIPPDAVAPASSMRAMPRAASTGDAAAQASVGRSATKIPQVPPRHAMPPESRGNTPRVNGAFPGARDASPVDMVESAEPDTMVAPLLPEQDKSRKPRPAVRNEQRPTRVAQASSQQNWYVAMKSQLNQCASDPNVFSRVICAEQAKFRYCSPNRWGQVAECVRTQHRDISTINEKSGKWMLYPKEERVG